MKKIMITSRIVEIQAYNEWRDALDVRWSQFLASCGSIITVPFPSFADPVAFIEELQIDGMVFSGGNDLSTCSPEAVNQKRDLIEQQLLELAIAKGIPVIGVCRGAQLIANYYRARLKGVSNEMHVNNRHDVHFSGASSFFGRKDGIEQVNSYHSWGIDELTSPLLPAAKSPDGTVEAFYHESSSIKGVMWHPEREEPFCQSDRLMVARAFDLGS